MDSNSNKPTNPFEALQILGEQSPVDPRRTALLVIDMVHCQVTPGTGMLAQLEAMGLDTSYIIARVRDAVTPNINRLAGAFRATGAPVVYLRIGGADAELRDTLPRGRQDLILWGARDGELPSAVIDELAPQPGDLSLLKLGSGAFTTSNLDRHLRFMGIDTLFYTGVLTNACVLLTMASGFDLGYQGYLVCDGTAALSEDMQQHTEAIIDGLLGRPVSTADACALLEVAAKTAATV